MVRSVPSLLMVAAVQEVPPSVEVYAVTSLRVWSQVTFFTPLLKIGVITYEPFFGIRRLAVEPFV